MAFSPDAVANYILDLAARDGRPVTPMKLQKLMYFAHGWHLALEKGGAPLVGEDVQAWDYGPVFPSTYQEFKDFRNLAITRKAAKTVAKKRGQVEFDDPDIESEASLDPSIDLPFARAVIDRIWDVYNPVSATRLSEMTHEEGSPWWTVREEAKRKFRGYIPKGLNIPNETIRDWFVTRQRRAAGHP